MCYRILLNLSCVLTKSTTSMAFNNSTSINEILSDFHKLGLSYDLKPEYTDKPDEWIVAKYMEIYIAEHDDILPDHKPLFYKIFSRHPRWSEKAKDDITIYQAGPKIKSYGSILRQPDGTQKITSISYLKCIYGEDKKFGTIDALFNSTFAARCKMKDKCYATNGHKCDCCHKRYHYRDLNLIDTKLSHKQIAHNFLTENQLHVLDFQNVNGRETLTDPTMASKWIEFFITNSNPSLACFDCRKNRLDKMLSVRYSKFSFQKTLC